MTIDEQRPDDDEIRAAAERYFKEEYRDVKGFPYGSMLQAMAHAIRRDRNERQETFPHCERCGSSAWFCTACFPRPDDLDAMLRRLAEAEPDGKLFPRWYWDGCGLQMASNQKDNSATPTEAVDAALKGIKE